MNDLPEVGGMRVGAALRWGDAHASAVGRECMQMPVSSCSRPFYYSPKRSL